MDIAKVSSKEFPLKKGSKLRREWDTRVRKHVKEKTGVAQMISMVEKRKKLDHRTKKNPSSLSLWKFLHVFQLRLVGRASVVANEMARSHLQHPHGDLYPTGCRIPTEIDAPFSVGEGR